MTVEHESTINAFRIDPNSVSSTFHEDEDLYKLQQVHHDAFQQIFSRCTESDKRCKELEEQLKVLRNELSASREKFESQTESMRKQQKLMEAEMSLATFDSPLVVALIDGDGCIFSQELLSQGEAGGRKAAEKLMGGINSYLRSAEESIPAGIKIWAILFLSKSGLAATLERHNICTADTFTSFMNGFNQAHGLFAVVDCGNAKEAADNKMRDHLEALIRGPQVYRVFFGGSHDNGYSGTISSLKTLGFGHKLIILQSYSEIACEIAKLQLQTLPCNIEGLFMKDKLEFTGHRRQSGSTSSSTPAPKANQQKFSYSAIVSSIGSEASSPPKSPPAISVKRTTLETGRKKLNPNIPLSKQNPRPCFAQYLASGGKCVIPDCAYGHNYELTPRDQQRLMAMAANIPCRNETEENPCYREDCFMGHYCPNGPECLYKKQGRCRFKGEHMHDA